MTTNEPTNLELAEKFVSDKHWRWLPGMRDTATGWLVVEVDQRVGAWSSDGWTADGYPNGDIIATNSVGMRPDLGDPATLGCIEHGLVPTALSDPNACLCFNPNENNWYVYSPKHDECTTSKDTKPAALLAALEEAADIVRRSGERARAVEGVFDDPDDLDDFDGGFDRDEDGYDDSDSGRDDRDGYDERVYDFGPDEAPTDPKLCTRPPPPQTIAARGFLDALRQRDADREAQRLAKLREKGTPT